MTLEYPANDGYPSFEVSQEELDKYVGRKIVLRSGRPGTIEKAFVSNPCGYWSICFRIRSEKGNPGHIMKSEVAQYIDP